MLSPSLLENFHGRIEAEGFLIGPLGSERVEHVGYNEDAGCDRDVPAAQSNSEISITACYPFVLLHSYEKKHGA